MKKIIILLTLCLFVAVMVSCQGATTTYDTSEWADFQYFNHEQNLADHLYVLPDSAVSTYEEMVTAQALQGIVAQTKSEIYIEKRMGEYEPYKDYLHILEEDYDITYEYVDSLEDLIFLFKDRVTGYTLYTANTDSVNIAQTYSGLRQTLPATQSQVDMMDDLGIELTLDLSKKDYWWLIETFGDEINWDYVIQQNPSYTGIRDLGVANKGLYMFYHYTALGASEYLRMGKDSPMLGWGSTDEVSDVADLSYYGITTVASDHAWNLSILSAAELHIDSFQQKFDRKPIKTEDKHYVTFILSDGDNVQYMLNNYYQSSRTFGAEDRGEIPFGWSIAPTMYDLAPTVLKEYYDNASAKDYILPGVSGAAYFYPDAMPEDALKIHVERTNEYFKRLDLDYGVIMGTRRLDTDKSSLEAYAMMPEIRGMFLYANYDRYMGYRGEIWWINDKPFLSARNALWDTEDLSAFAEMINNYKVDPSSIDGYTVVTVHTWSHTFEDVMNVINQFDDDVVVVSPYHLMELIQENIPHENARPS
jgi:hypothetical protein